MKTGTKIFILLGVFAISFSITFLLGEKRKQRDNKATNEAAKSEQRSSRPLLPLQSLEKKLHQSLELGTEFHQAKKKLTVENRSPLRLQAFLDHHLEEQTYEEIVEVLKNSRALSEHDIQKIAKRITLERPQETFKGVFIDRTVHFGSLEGYYAFAPSFARTWLDHHDPMDLLRNLESMKPGGSQQDISLTVSGQWVWRDPKSTAELFDRLTTLRSVSANGTPNTARQYFADLITRSWRKRAPKEFATYINNLPPGLARTHLHASLEKAEKAEVKN